MPHIESLVARAKDGEEAAFRALYDHLADRLVSYLRARVPSRDDALDATQDVMVDLWRALSRFEYRSDAHFYGFVFTIAKRRLAKAYQNARTLESVDDLLPSEHPRVDADVTDPDGMRPLVDALPEKYREVLVLRYWSGLSFAEIGEMLGESENTVKVRHHRALRKIESNINTHE